MMRSLIDAARARGEPVAVLWATEDTIYGQFGYGMASMAAEIDVPRDHAAASFARDRRAGDGASCSAGRGRAVGGADLRSRGAADARHVRALVRLVAGPAADRSGRGSAAAAALCSARCWRSAASRRPMRSIASTRPSSAAVEIGHILVVEAMGDLAGSDARDLALPVRHRLDGAREGALACRSIIRCCSRLAEPRRLNFLVREGMWVRLIDVGAALSARGYAIGRRDRHRGGGRILPLERRALARRARRRREDRCAEPISPARSPRSAASISAASASRSLRARCA